MSFHQDENEEIIQFIPFLFLDYKYIFNTIILWIKIKREIIILPKLKSFWKISIYFLPLPSTYPYYLRPPDLKLHDTPLCVTDIDEVTYRAMAGFSEILLIFQKHSINIIFSKTPAWLFQRIQASIFNMNFLRHSDYHSLMSLCWRQSKKNSQLRLL